MFRRNIPVSSVLLYRRIASRQFGKLIVVRILGLERRHVISFRKFADPNTASHSAIKYWLAVGSQCKYSEPVGFNSRFEGAARPGNLAVPGYHLHPLKGDNADY